MLTLGVFGIIVGGISAAYWLIASTMARTGDVNDGSWSGEYVAETVKLTRVLAVVLIPLGLALVLLAQFLE